MSKKESSTPFVILLSTIGVLGLILAIIVISLLAGLFGKSSTMVEDYGIRL